MMDSKKQILHTALKLFLQKTYKEVSLRDIVNEVGLTKGAFYHYYRSKEEVFEEAVKYFYSHGLITNYSAFPKTSLKEFYEYYLDTLQRPDEFDDIDSNVNFFIFLSDASRKIPDFLGIHSAQRKKELWGWAEIMDTAKRNKEIKSSLANEDLAILFLNISDGIMINKMLNRKEREEVLKDIRKDWDNLYSLLKYNRK